MRTLRAAFFIANADRDLLLILALLLRRIQGNQIPNQPHVGRTSSRQTLHPYEKGDGIKPGAHRLASLIFSKRRRESIRLLDPLAFRLADALLPQSRNSVQGFAHRLNKLQTLP